MQNSLSFKGDRPFAKHKNNLIRGLTAVVVLLPQALVFVAASEVEHKGEFYIAVLVGTIAAAITISFLSNKFKSERDIIPAATKQNRIATLLHHSQNS